MSSIEKRISDLEAAARIQEPPPPIYSWHGGQSSEKPPFYDHFDWLYFCVEPSRRELFLCSADRGELARLGYTEVKPGAYTSPT